jgi:polygalacturonase
MFEESAPKTLSRRHFVERSLRGAVSASTLAAFGLGTSCTRPAAAPFAGSGASHLDVKRFGAVGDGQTLDSDAINAAIAAAAQAGGGSVYFPPGVYLSASLRLQSNITLYLEAGSVIRAVDHQRAPYDLPEPNEAGGHYQDFGHSHWKNSLIWGIGLQNVAIIGPGLIHGEGLNPGFDRFAPEATRYRDGGPGSANKAIALRECHNVSLRDFSILHGGHFGILATGVDNLLIDNLKIDTNRDGIDIDACQNVRVSHCSVNSPWDDGICLKASYGLGRLRHCENITISDCYLAGNFDEGTLLDGSFARSAPEYGSYRTGRIKLGTESNGDFRNIAITNCVFDDCRGLAIESVDGSHIEDLVISNITMRRVASGPIFIRLGNRARGPAPVAVGSIRRVSIDNVVVHDAEADCTISGIEGHPIEDVRISNLRAEFRGGGNAAMAEVVPEEKPAAYPEPGMFGPIPAYAFFIRHARGVVIHDAKLDTIEGDARPAFVLDDVVGADFSELDVQPGQGGKSFELRRSGGIRVHRLAGLADRELERVVERERF